MLLALTWVLPPVPAHAQIESREGIALQNQILDLQQQIEALRSGGGASGGSMLGGAQPTPLSGQGGTGGIGTQLLDRVQRLEDAVRELRGRIDAADNTRQQQYDQLNKKIDDLAFRLGAAPPADVGAGVAVGASAAGAAGAGAPANLPTAQEKLVPPPALPATVPAAKRTPELILQQGNAALAHHDYADAEAAAKEVLANGKGPRATDAQFLLAQALAGRKDWSAAAVAYDDAYNRSRTGIHAPDSLLGLAGALIAINEKRAACETLNKLRAEFPSPRADLKEPIAQARRSAACH
jgi:TolA-binding protein